MESRPAWRRWLRRIGIGLAGIVIAGFCYERIASLVDARRLPPSGTLVDAGAGRRLHVHCEGAGGPAVILEAGLTDWSIAWSRVQPTLARSTRVCSYDRAGLGSSDPRRAPTTPSAMNEDLDRVIELAGLTPPFVLVGHSAGGLLMRRWAALHPDRVRGLVLVDAAQPEMERVWGPIEPLPAAQRALGALAQIGLARLLLGVVGMERFAPEARFLAPAIKARYAAGIRKRFEAMADERLAFVDLLHHMPAEPRASFPLVVLTAREAAGGDGEQWVAMQKESLGLSDRARQVVVESGHYIQFSHPDVVVEAVRSVLQGP